MHHWIHRALKIFCLTALTIGFAASAQAESISGAGATFPNPIYTKWAKAYQEKTGVEVNYAAIGSGGGLSKITDRTIDFGASDKPTPALALEKNDLIQFPMIIGGIVPILNVPGIKSGDLKLTGPLLADIFMAKITKWNDPQIVALNSGVKLPDMTIRIVHRSDASGTTFNLSSYLTDVSEAWKNQDGLGTNTDLKWSNTSIGAPQNDGVATSTKETDGAIGYVEYAYAKKADIPYILVQNKDGNYPKPSAASFAAAAANADWANTPGFNLLLSNQPGKDSWPITASSFILLHKTQDNPDKAKQILAFFDWAYKNGQAMAEQLDFVAIPPNVVKLVEAEWGKIKTQDGKPIYTGSPS